MARYFAELDENDVVIRVIVIEPEMLETGLWGDPANWVETDLDAFEGKGFRKNYAGIDDKYDHALDAFMAPKPFPSWILDTEKASYDAPVKQPADGKNLAWDEKTLSWVKQ